MSITVDYFFNHPDNLVEVAEMVRQVIGVQLEPYEGNAEDLFCRFISPDVAFVFTAWTTMERVISGASVTSWAHARRSLIVIFVEFNSQS